MKKYIYVSIFLCVLFMGASHLSAISGNDIKQALDSPPGVEFSAPGNYQGSNSDWGIGSATGKAGTNIPIDLTNVGNRNTGKQGYLSAIGYKCLYGKIPSQARGKAGTYEDRARNYFTVTVKGDGVLSFNYRTSLDSSLDASLWIYEYAGDNSQGTIVPSATFTQPPLTRLWAKKTDNYDLYDDAFWTEEYGIDVNSKNAYTHTIVFAIVGNAKYNSQGKNISSDISSQSNLVLENRVYLDNFYWESDKTPLFTLSEYDTTFSQKLDITVTSDYSDKVFSYYYTLDGTEPTTDSPQYTGKITITDSRTLKIRAYENATKKFEGDIVSSTYTRVLAAPTYVVDSKNFNGKTKVTIYPSKENGSTSYYSLQGAKGVKFSQPMEFTYNNTDIKDKDIIHLKAFKPEQSVKDAEFSDTIIIQLSQSSKPNLKWKIDGVESTETTFMNTVEIINPDGNLYTEPENGQLTQDGTIRAVAVEEGKIASEVVSQAFTKSKDPFTIAKGDFYPNAETNTSWAFYVMPGKMSEADQAKLAAWMHPYSHDGSKRVYTQTTALNAGEVYLVYCPSLDWSNPPQGLYYSPLIPEKAETGWQLVPKEPDFTLENGMWKSSSGTKIIPGWKRK